MRILFLTQVLPYPLDAGPKIRSYYVIRYLAEMGHEVTLLSFVRDSDSTSAVEHLQDFCTEVHTVRMQRSPAQDLRALTRSLFTHRPFLIARDWVPEMSKAVKHLLGRGDGYDAVHADQLWMAPYALLARSVDQSCRPMLILDQHNAVFQIPKRMAEAESNPVKRSLLHLEAQKLQDYEWRICPLFDQVVWVTEQDKAAFHCLGAKGEGFPSETVIPISVNSPRHAPNRRGSDPTRITFLGGLHWPPNRDGILWFFHKVWPRLERQLALPVLTVIGKDPPRQLIRCAAKSDRLDVTGYVENLAPYLDETAVFIIPVRAGGGMRVKILDAWRWGLPIVSTVIGAEGMRVEDGSNLLLADSARDFAQAVLRVFEDPKLGSSLAKSGQETLKSHYTWRLAYSSWQEIYPCESYSSSLMRQA